MNGGGGWWCSSRVDGRTFGSFFLLMPPLRHSAPYAPLCCALLIPLLYSGVWLTIINRPLWRGGVRRESWVNEERRGKCLSPPLFSQMTALPRLFTLARRLRKP